MGAQATGAKRPGEARVAERVTEGHDLVAKGAGSYVGVDPASCNALACTSSGVTRASWLPGDHWPSWGPHLGLGAWRGDDAVGSR
jgi:hypothetical protein